MGLLPLTAQQASRQSATRTYDVNGRLVEVGGVSSTTATTATARTERSRSINGRLTPLESVEETVLEQGPGGKVIERLTRRYDPTGRQGSPEKVRIEERKNADGSTTVETITWQGDVNGRLQLFEKSVTQSVKSGETQRSETMVQRPSPGGALELVEKRVVVETGKPESLDTDATLYRKNQGGSLYQAAREVTQRRVQQGVTTETSTQYNAANSGKLEFAGSTASRTEKRPDGSEIQTVDVYGTVAQGRTIEGYSSGPKLREQQVIERTPGASGAVETVSIRRPALEGSQLGPLRKISETHCTGDCARK